MQDLAVEPAFISQIDAADDALAADIGILTHACLEQIAHQPDCWTPASLAGRKTAFERWFGSRGWLAPESNQASERVVSMLRIVQDSQEGRWVLLPRSDMAAEAAMSRLTPERSVETRVVDRCFVDDGVRWIIDYKTARVSESRADLCRHAERYRSQLESYASFFAGEGLPMALAVFYAAHGILARLDYNPDHENQLQT